MADDRRDMAVAESEDERQRVADQVEEAEGAEIAVVVAVPSGGPPIAALVGRHHMEPRRGERQHHLAPTVGELRKAVEEKEARPPFLREAGFEDVEAQPVDALDEARPYAGRQRRFGQGRERRHAARR